MKARNRGRMLLILAAAGAVIVFIVAYFLLKGPDATQNDALNQDQVPGQVVGQQPGQIGQTPQPQLTKVVVAKRDIPAYTTLTADHIETLDVEVNDLAQGGVSDPAAVLGKITALPFVAGAQITVDQLSTPSFSHTLGSDEMAFALPVTERSLFGGSLIEGDHIDVLWTGALEYYDNVPTGDAKLTFERKVYTSTKGLSLLQGLRVLKIIPLQPLGSGPLGPSAQTQDQQQTERVLTAAMFEDGAAYAAVLIVAVNEQQAELLKFARENGSIDLALRSSVPGGKQDSTSGVSIDTLLQQGLIGPKTQP